MDKREIITRFRNLYPALAIPTVMRKIHTGYALLASGERVVGIERLRSMAYIIALLPKGAAEFGCTSGLIVG